MTVGGFLRWWAGELRALAPRRLRERRTGEVACLVVGDERIEQRESFDDAAPVLASWTLAPDGAGAPAGDELPHTAAVQLRFAPGRALSRRVGLPLATQENLGEVLGFEMERLTPFRREDVYWRYRVARRDPQAKRLEIDLLVVPRSVADPALAVLGLEGLAPSVEAGQSSEGGALDLEFRREREAPGGRGWLIPALVVLNVALAIGLVASHLARQDRTLAVLERETAAAAGAAQRADALRTRLESLRAAGEFVDAQARARTPVVLLVEALSELLSDDTWLTRLEIRGADVHLHGVSASASDLIAVLDESEYLTRARFASPVVRDAASGRDRFHITATVVAAGGAS